MALNYSVSLRPNPLEREASPKAYATAQMNGELSLKQLSRRVSSQTTVSRADVVAVLTATVDNLLEALKEGKQVDFGDLGKFRLQITSRGADSLEKFTASCITGINIQYVPGEDLKTSPLPAVPHKQPHCVPRKKAKWWKTCSSPRKNRLSRP